ncbi:MAG TPA: class I SAM-dependent methyltransferase [Spirochaetia bacterium]|nr:class I SAM-dependent methyltransferase [Spirochaetia bacterium]
MPSMFEIYEKHAAEYDELVDAEDFQGNLHDHILQVVDWDRKSVIEAGTGTGRVTRIYADRASAVTCFDQSQHMLDRAAGRLSKSAAPITFRVADNMHMPQVSPKCDIFIEGWSWGHSIIDAPGSVESVTETLIQGARSNLVRNGEIVLIETMGTNTPEPTPPHTRLARFYELLVSTCSFHQDVVRTDYRFPTADVAIRVMGFFFGPEMEQSLKNSMLTEIPEWTGVWHRSMSEI